MIVHQINANYSLSDFESNDTIFEIHVAIDLQSQTVLMGNNTVLRFVEGSFSNGTITGNDSYIEASGCHPVFFSVVLNGQWRGAINDQLFSYNPNPLDVFGFNSILGSLLRFERIDLSRPKYYFQWSHIWNNTSQNIDLDGHGAVFYISSNKGTAHSGSWGNEYPLTQLISFDASYRSSFRVCNLVIEDNSDTSTESGYGEQNVNTVHTRYSIFVGLATGITEFDNVKYNGGGQFCKLYNHFLSADKLIFRNCDLHCNGFAVEIQCVDCSADLGPGHIGHLNKVLFDNCILHTHFNNYVGVLSFVGEGHINFLRIINSRICGYPGNLEVCGVKRVLIDNTVFVNHGLCSEVYPEGNGMLPGIYTCTNCRFYLTIPATWPRPMSFCVRGEHVYLANNYFYLIRFIRFCEIHRLYLYNNQFVSPGTSDIVLVTENDVKIGYYGNNRVSCSCFSNNHVCPRLDTAYVMAQYEPFIVAFKDDIEKDVWNQGFNWSKGLIPATLLEGGSLSVDQDGYAWDSMDMASLSTIPVQDTVTITLIGKPFAPPSGEPEPEMVFCEIGDMIPVTITNTAQSVYRVYLWGRLIADITRVAFSPNSEDVRLDVTITQINGHLDIFVFVNQELYAKDRSNALEQYSPTGLTFTPNLFTGIRAIRFVPGGFILDEPETLMTDLLDE